jgi:hypothetical protein
MVGIIIFVGAVTITVFVAVTVSIIVATTTLSSAATFSLLLSVPPAIAIATIVFAAN